MEPWKRVEKIGDATLYLGDCMDYMATLPDKAFELAIVDPPYGIGLKFSTKEQKTWNNNIPPMEYFNELIRVSSNQIIWGINYFPKLHNDIGGRIVWYKKPTMNNKMQISDCDIAFYSKHRRIGYFEYQYYGNVENGSIDWIGSDRIHPTQKPVALYRWLLSRYAKPGDRILDTHGGSGSIVIACLDLGFAIDWIELDPEYYEAAYKRIKLHAAQPKLFEDEKPVIKDQDLFKE